MRLPRGYSLVEVLVSMAILGLVMTGALLLVTGINGSSERTRRVGDAQTGARLALEQIESDIRAAGIGASRGHVGLAPAGGPIKRVPIIYSEPANIVTTPGGAQVQSASLFIISADVSSVGITTSGVGMQGVISDVTKTDAGVTTAVTVSCAGNDGTSLRCDSTSAGVAPLLPSDGGTSPLLVSDDFHWAIIISPSNVQIGSSTTSMSFLEINSPSFDPDPKQPYGFGHAAHLLRARVVHWYVKNDEFGVPKLYRSFPTLRTTQFTTSNVNSNNCSSAQSEAPFLDETNGGTVVGTQMSNVPIDALWVQYMFGNVTGSDQPDSWQSSWNLLNSSGDAGTGSMLTPCDGTTSLKAVLSPAEMLREVRVAVIARTETPDQVVATRGDAGTLYSPPTINGYNLITNLPSAASTLLDAGSTITVDTVRSISDAYPRRTFQTRVVPRNALGYVP